MSIEPNALEMRCAHLSCEATEAITVARDLIAQTIGHLVAADARPYGDDEIEAATAIYQSLEAAEDSLDGLFISALANSPSR